MTEPHGQTPRDLLAAFHRAMIALSADDLAELHAPDALYEFPLLTPGRPERYEGREQIRAGFAEVWSAAGVRVTEVRDVVVHQTTDDGVLVAEQQAAATVIETGERFLAASLLILEVRDGTIIRTRDYSAGTRRPDQRAPASAGCRIA